MVSKASGPTQPEKGPSWTGSGAHSSQCPGRQAVGGTLDSTSQAWPRGILEEGQTRVPVGQTALASNSPPINKPKTWPHTLSPHEHPDRPQGTAAPAPRHPGAAVRGADRRPRIAENSPLFLSGRSWPSILGLGLRAPRWDTLPRGWALVLPSTGLAVLSQEPRLKAGVQARGVHPHVQSPCTGS